MNGFLPFALIIWLCVLVWGKTELISNSFCLPLEARVAWWQSVVACHCCGMHSKAMTRIRFSAQAFIGISYQFGASWVIASRLATFDQAGLSSALLGFCVVV